MLPYADRPITKINVQGDLSYISQQAVQQRIAPYVASSFFTIDPESMRTELETMPWIAHAEVRRGVAGSSGDPPGRTTAGGLLGR